MLELEQVRRTFNGVVAVDDVSLAVPDRGVLGLIGPNGAGKTTLVNLITGYLAPDAGRIAYRGASVLGRRPHELAEAGIARTYQNLRLFEGASVRENVRIGRHMAASRAARPWRPGRRVDPVCEQVLDRVGLAEVARARVDELSYGTRRRVEIARALATGCSLLLLDEPTAGMTGAEAAEVGDLIRAVADGGVAVLLVEHNIPLVTRLCDELVVLDFGRRIANGPPDEVWARDDVKAAYVGRDRRSTAA